MGGRVGAGVPTVDIEKAIRRSGERSSIDSLRDACHEGRRIDLLVRARGAGSAINEKASSLVLITPKQENAVVPGRGCNRGRRCDGNRTAGGYRSGRECRARFITEPVDASKLGVVSRAGGDGGGQGSPVRRRGQGPKHRRKKNPPLVPPRAPGHGPETPRGQR